MLHDLSNPLTDRGIAFVDLNKQVVAASKREQQLYDEGRSATPVSYNPLEPAYEIAGDGTQLPNGRVTMTLSLKNLVTGKVMATKAVTGNGRTLREIEDLFAELSSEFAGDASGVIDRSPTGGRVTVDLDVTFLHEGSGSGSVTASPPGRTLTRTDCSEANHMMRSMSSRSLVGRRFRCWRNRTQAPSSSVGVRQSVCCLARGPSRRG